MTTAVLNTPRRRASRERCAGDRGRGLTLEQRLGATLAGRRGRARRRTARVCRGSDARGPAARAVCGDCGSQLS